MPTFRGKWKSVFSGRHTDNVPKETHAVSVMTQRPLATVGGDAPNSKAKQTDGEKGDKERSSDKRSQTVCRKKL